MNADYAVKTRDYTIRKGDALIFGKLYEPEAEGIFPLVVIGHGYNGSWQDWTQECQYFAEHGIAAFAYDFCGGSTHSQSSGLTTDMTVLTERDDVIAVFHAFRQMEQFAPIFLMGGSQGGFATALAAEQIRDLAAGMVLYYPALCITDNWKEKYPQGSEVPECIDFWDMRLGRCYADTACSMDALEQIGSFGKPVLIIHGTDDPVVPISYSERAAAGYPDARMTALPGEGHGFSPEGSAEAMKLAYRFMEDLLKPYLGNEAGSRNNGKPEER